MKTRLFEESISVPRFTRGSGAVFGARLDFTSVLTRGTPSHQYELHHHPHRLTTVVSHANTVFWILVLDGSFHRRLTDHYEGISPTFQVYRRSKICSCYRKTLGNGEAIWRLSRAMGDIGMNKACFSTTFEDTWCISGLTVNLRS